MTTIRVKENEPFDVALRRFKRTIEKLGLLTDLRAREFYEKPTAERKRKKAEVTLGGIDTRALSQQTMESKAQSGLYFIGEVVDITGWLGGYNFQWAWASAHACAQALPAA